MPVALIGTGRISDLNVLGYLNNHLCEVVAVADRDVKRAERRLKKWGIPEARAYESYERMVSHEDPVIVDVLTPHHLHAPMTLKLAEMGVPAISVQKPMATTVHECQKMVDACHDAGAKLKVYENFVFYPPYREAKRLIDAGAIGEPISVSVRTYSAAKGGWKVPLKTWLWRVKSEYCGGGPVVFDDGFHKFSVAYWLMGCRPVDRVWAWIDDGTFADTPAHVIFTFKDEGDGFQRGGTIEFTMGSHATWPSKYYSCDEFVDVVGTSGRLRVNQCTSGGNALSQSPHFPPVVVVTEGKVVAHGLGLERDWSASFRESTKHFVEVVVNDLPPLYTGEQGLLLTQFAKAPYVSAEERRPVSLDELSPEWDAAGCNIGSKFSYRKFLGYALRVLRGPATKYQRAQANPR
ncbi:MAG: Gfo/Idh/MocA family oxidoreductase [Promethearchaeota archaeon]